MLLFILGFIAAFVVILLFFVFISIYYSFFANENSLS